MEKEYYTIKEISEFLSLKPSNLYSKVNSGSIPHYKVGRLILFKINEVEEWMEENKKQALGAEKKAKAILKSLRGKSNLDVEKLRDKVIEEVNGKVYSNNHGKLDQNKGLRKEVPNGSI